MEKQVHRASLGLDAAGLGFASSEVEIRITEMRATQYVAGSVLARCEVA
jgi:hypothetical protein